MSSLVVLQFFSVDGKMPHIICLHVYELFVMLYSSVYSIKNLL